MVNTWDGAKCAGINETTNVLPKWSEKMNKEHYSDPTAETAIAAASVMPWAKIIPLEPRTKKNSQQIYRNKATGKRFISTSSAYKAYLDAAGMFLGGKRLRRYAGPVQVQCLFYMGTARRVDLVNLLECIDDVLVHYGILADDNSAIIVSHDGSRVLIDRNHPRTEIYITEARNGR